MQVTLRYFASAREAAGIPSETYDLAPGTTVAGLFVEACTRHPALEALRAHLRFALGEAFVETGTPLEESAVVALIPPVAGG